VKCKLSSLPVSVEIPLPFCLRLQDKDYKVRYEEKVYLCHLRKVWSDFASGCDPDKNEGPIKYEFLFQATTGKITKASNMEIDFDKKGFFRHTVFSTTVYLDESSKPEEIPKRVINAVLPLVNKFLKAYRYVTGEFHVTEIQWPDLCMIRDGEIMPILIMDYSVQPPQRQKIIGWFGGDENPLTTTKPNVAKEEHKEIEKRLFEENPSFPLEKDLWLNARDYTRQGRYGLAVFELGTALEVAVNNLLFSKGMDKKELRYSRFKDRYDSILNKHAGVSLKNARSTLFSDVLKIWEIRNNVAHKRLVAFTDEKGNLRRIESKDEVEPLIRSTEQTLNFLNAL
jgi:hypothetical protein